MNILYNLKGYPAPVQCTSSQTRKRTKHSETLLAFLSILLGHSQVSLHYTGRLQNGQRPQDFGDTSWGLRNLGLFGLLNMAVGIITNTIPLGSLSVILSKYRYNTTHKCILNIKAPILGAFWAYGPIFQGVRRAPANHLSVQRRLHPEHAKDHF